MIECVVCNIELKAISYSEHTALVMIHKQGVGEMGYPIKVKVCYDCGMIDRIEKVMRVIE